MARFPRMDDVMADIRDELRRLNANLSSDLGETIINVQEDGQQQSGGSEPRYFTSGEGGILVDHLSFKDDIPFGLKASTVNLRFDAPIVVAFKSPHDRETIRIPLFADNSPFTIGDGDAPINAEAVWLKKMDSSTSDPVVHIVAKR